jgi:hypothetical protein
VPSLVLEQIWLLAGNVGKCFYLYLVMLQMFTCTLQMLAEDKEPKKKECFHSCKVFEILTYGCFKKTLVKET